jgi:hypothetical protein
MKFITIIFVFTAFISCGSYEPKKDVGMNLYAEDAGIEIRDTSFELKNPSKVILYTVTKNREEEEFLKHIAQKLSERGVETIIDHGQIVDYGTENYRIRTKEKLMSFHHYLQIVGTGRKESEPVIADLKADSVQKLVELLMKVVFEE